MFHPKWEQSPSQFWCQKSKRNSNDEVEWKHSCWKKKHLLNWEALKPTGFENSPKCPASCPSLLHLVVSSLHRQANFLRHFPIKKSTYWRYNGSRSSGIEEGRMNGRIWSMIYRLICWNEMLCYSCEFVPQIISSSIISWNSFGGTNAGPVAPLSKADSTFHSHLISESWHLWVGFKQRSFCKL